MSFANLKSRSMDISKLVSAATEASDKYLTPTSIKTTESGANC